MNNPEVEALRRHVIQKAAEFWADTAAKLERDNRAPLDPALEQFARGLSDSAFTTGYQVALSDFERAAIEAEKHGVKP